MISLPLPPAVAQANVHEKRNKSDEVHGQRDPEDQEECFVEGVGDVFEEFCNPMKMVVVS